MREEEEKEEKKSKVREYWERGKNMRRVVR
jgi:hypothetical protein